MRDFLQVCIILIKIAVLLPYELSKHPLVRSIIIGTIFGYMTNVSMVFLSSSKSMGEQLHEKQCQVEKAVMDHVSGRVYSYLLDRTDCYEFEFKIFLQSQDKSGF